MTGHPFVGDREMHHLSRYSRDRSLSATQVTGAASDPAPAGQNVGQAGARPAVRGPAANP